MGVKNGNLFCNFHKIRDYKPVKNGVYCNQYSLNKWSTVQLDLEHYNRQAVAIIFNDDVLGHVPQEFYKGF